jgi:hypothetical protein
MINRSDWQAVRDALIADDRVKLGEPPTVEELLAYERGELSKEDAERVQQLLIAYPELARAYATPFPSEDGELPGDVVDRQWNAFRAGNRAAGGTNARVLQFWRGFAAVAAAVAIVFGAMLWRTRAEALRPRVLPEANILTPDGVRGSTEQSHYPITLTGDAVLLAVSIIGPTDYERYRLEMVRSDSHERVWSSAPLPATSSNTFNVEVPSRALAPGTYQVIAYGLRGNAREEIATYTIDVRRPAAR